MKKRANERHNPIIKKKVKHAAIPLDILTLLHHLSSISSFQTQIQVLKLVGSMARDPHLPNHGSKDQLMPINMCNSDIRKQS